MTIGYFTDGSMNFLEAQPLIGVMLDRAGKIGCKAGLFHHQSFESYCDLLFKRDD
jgi:hypothetical protein